MARTAAKTANILSQMYDESFAGEEMEMFRIGWAELRSLAGIPKLTDDFLAGINSSLALAGYVLIPFDDFLLVAGQSDFSHTRKMPPRFLEQNLPDVEEDVDLDDEEIAVDDENE